MHLVLSDNRAALAFADAVSTPVFEMQEAGAASMTLNMMLGAGVLVATQLVIVGIAAAWFIRTQRKAGHDSSEASRE